jgi:hypothetical protein
LGLLVEVLLVLLGLGTILGGVSVFAACCIVAWIVLALIYVAIILWFAWYARLLPDQTDTQETALVLPSWLVFLLGWTPVIAAFMGLIGGLTEQVGPDQIADQITQLLTTDRDTALRIARVAIDAVTVLMAVLGWSLLHLGYARHYERLDHLYGSAIEFPGTKDAELTELHVLRHHYRHHLRHIRRQRGVAPPALDSGDAFGAGLLLQRHRHGDRLQDPH